MIDLRSPDDTLEVKNCSWNIAAGQQEMATRFERLGGSSRIFKLKLISILFSRPIIAGNNRNLSRLLESSSHPSASSLNSPLHGSSLSARILSTPQNSPLPLRNRERKPDSSLALVLS